MFVQLVLSNDNTVEIMCDIEQWKFPLTMIRTGLQWFLTSTGAAASSHLETGAFVRSRPDVAFPDIQLHFLPSVILDHGQKMGNFHAFQATFCFCCHYTLLLN